METCNKSADMCIKEEICETSVKVEPEYGDQNITNSGNNFMESDTRDIRMKTEDCELKLKSEESCDEKLKHAVFNGCREEVIAPARLNEIKKEEGNDEDTVKYVKNFTDSEATDFLIKNEEVAIKHEYFGEDESCTKSELQSCSVWNNVVSGTSLDAGDRHSTDKSANKFEKSIELRIYKCAKCPYQNISKRLLRQHMRSHSDVKPYECDVCFYKAKLKSALQQHMYTHWCLSDRPVYKCDLCPHLAKFRGSLKVHVLTHKSSLEAKKYQCALCPYRAKVNSYLAKHLLTHKSVLYECDVCKSKFKNKYGLYRHKRQKHECR